MKVKGMKKVVAKSVSKKPEKKATKPKKNNFDDLVLNHRENGRKLGRSILRRWRVRMPTDEIDSIVDLALCEAAQRYSAEKGAAFMTFFFYHLRGHLVRAVARAAQSSNIFMAFGESAGMDVGDWQDVDAEALWGYLPDSSVFGNREVETPENKVIQNETINECRTAVAKLDKLEQQILQRSFTEEQPLVDIAKSLGYSRCHISRVKKSALDQLKVTLCQTQIIEKRAARAMLKRRGRRVVEARLAKNAA
jgi:RNA polymerase sigma factor (sigma-70 family)